MAYCKWKIVFCNSEIFVSIPIVSNISSKALAGVPRSSTTTNGLLTFIFYTFFGSLARSKYFSIFSTYYSCVIRYSEVNYLAFMVFFIKGFCLMLIPFRFSMDSTCSTNFPINLSSDPIMPSFLLFLNKFGTFTYNVVNCLISPTANSAFRLLL